MMKDVQRTFVLLRQCGSGRESGYARAEARDGKVKLNLVVQGFSAQDEAFAFGAAQDGVLLVGRLNLDGRGQGGIAAELSAQEMRSLQVLFVAVLRGDATDIPLAGTVGRGGWVDWSQVRALVTQALRPNQDERQRSEDAQERAPAQEERRPEEQQLPVQEEQPSAQEEQPPMREESTEARPLQEEDCPEEEPVPEEAKVQPPVPQDEPEPEEETPPVCEEERREPEEAAKEAERITSEEDFYDLPAQEDPFEVVERSLRTPLPKEMRRELPEALRNAYWPQQLWPLHDLFERFEQAHPFGRDDAVYVRVPLGGKWGNIDHYLVGASVEDSWVTGVGYLIPGEKNAPPAGLAGYEWQDGYWQAWQFVENGE